VFRVSFGGAEMTLRLRSALGDVHRSTTGLLGLQNISLR
jgi:hypothetical protein